MQETSSISLIISGKVQGVFYRQSTKEKAIELGLTGYVRNMEDNNVAVIATGTKEHLKKLVQWCWQGPPEAKVTGLEVKEIPLQQFDKFSIQRG